MENVLVYKKPSRNARFSVNGEQESLICQIRNQFYKDTHASQKNEDKTLREDE